jgi:hypothetical protein
MRPMSYDHAKEVIKKYFLILTAKNNMHLFVKDVNVAPSKKDTSKVVVQVITNDGTIEDLDNRIIFSTL